MLEHVCNIPSIRQKEQINTKKNEERLDKIEEKQIKGDMNKSDDGSSDSNVEVVEEEPVNNARSSPNKKGNLGIKQFREHLKSFMNMSLGTVSNGAD